MWKPKETRTAQFREMVKHVEITERHDLQCSRECEIHRDVNII